HVLTDKSSEGPSWQLLRVEPGSPFLEYPPDDYYLNATPTLLENQFVRATINDLGEITSLYDKEAKREVIPSGMVGNQLQAFEDRPMLWDAWDIDIFYDDKMWLATPGSVTVVESGPIRATLEVRKKILSSEVVQRITLDLLSHR